MHASHEPVHTHCQNCGEPLKGAFCHHCGQHDLELHGSFWHVVHDALENLFHFEGRFFRGTLDLLFNPGKMTLEFNAGRRASQMPPLRLYIFVSLLFFLAPGGTDWDIPDLDLGAQSKSLKQDTKAKPAQAVQIDLDEVPWLEDFLTEKLPHLRQIVRHLPSYIPKMMLFCLPVFALLTLLLFRTSGMCYLQHLVFSLHLHSFFMLFSLVSGGWSLVAGLFSSHLQSFLGMVFACWIPIYTYLALAGVFKRRRRSTVLRGLLLFSCYGAVLSGAFLTTFVVAMLLA